MIIVVTGWFPEYDKHGYKTGGQEFVASHGYDSDTGKTVILPCEHPKTLGATFDSQLNEWIL